MIKATAVKAPPVLQPPDTIVLEMDLESAMNLYNYIGKAFEPQLPKSCDFYRALGAAITRRS